MHSITQWFINEGLPAFSRTLVHSLWQGVVAAILAGIVIATTRRSPAVKRYNGLAGVYALFLLAVAVTFFYETGVPATTAYSSMTSAGSSPAILIIGNVTTAEAIDQSFGSSILHIANRNAVPLAGLWALLFFIQSARMALGLRYVQTIRKQGAKAVAGEWGEWIEKTSRKLGITKTVLLLQSERLKVPVALGFLKPVVLVPVGLMAQLSTQQVEAILLHELAHIRRKDYLVNLIQSFADAVFAFNPAVRWISARIREERETCCDNMVVQHTANKRGYVEALVSFSQLPLSSSYAMAIGSNKNHLLNRVKTIITRENSRLTVSEQATLLLGMAVLMAFGTFAFKPKEKEMKKEPVIEKKLPVVTKNTASTNTPSTIQIKRSKKLVTPSVPQHLVDTPPPSVTKIMEPIKWKNISTNSNDDGQGKTTQVIATAEDGTVYRIRKTDNEIVALSVNGREIAKENYQQYHSVTDAIEQAGKQRTADALRKQEQRTLALQQEREMLSQKPAMIDEKGTKALQQEQEVLKRKLSLQNEKRMKNFQQKQEALTRQMTKLDQHRKQFRIDSLHKFKYFDTYKQKEREYYQKEQEYNRKEQHYNKKEQDYNQKRQLYNQKQQNYNQNKNNSLNTNASLSAIIAELLANKLVENGTKLSFTLTATELVVNGKTMDKDLFEIFRKKYINSSGDSYSYFKDGGTTRTTINIQ